MENQVYKTSVPSIIIPASVHLSINMAKLESPIVPKRIRMLTRRGRPHHRIIHFARLIQRIQNHLELSVRRQGGDARGGIWGWRDVVR